MRNRHIGQCISYEIKYYHQHEQQCDNLARRATELIELSKLQDFFDGDITCEYQQNNGLVFVFELYDGESPHNVKCSLFFELFEGDISKITIQDLKRLFI